MKIQNLNQYSVTSIRALFLMVAVIIFLFIALIIYTTSKFVEDETSEMKESLILVSKEISSQVSLKMNRAFEINRFNVTTLKASQSNTELKISRAQFISLLHEELTDNPDFLGLYTLWEPNAFDNQDSSYRNTRYHDFTGRFIPYVASPDSTIIIEPIVNYYGDSMMDFYLLPKVRKKEIVMDPFIYPIQGRDVLMVSVLTPILIKGKFMGITGADFSVTYLQDMVSSFKFLGKEATTSIVTSSGIIVAMTGHPEFIGKRIDQLPDSYEKSFITTNITRSTIFENEDVFKSCTLIELGNTGTPWQICVSVPRTAIFSKVATIGWELGLILLLLISFWALIRSRYKLRKVAQESEITLKSIASNVNYSIWAVNKNRELIFFNDRFKTNIKAIFNVDIIIGLHILDIFSDTEERNFWLPIYDKAVTGELIDLDIDRSDRNFKFSFFPIKVKEELTGVIVISHEITDRVRESNKLKEVEKAAAKSELTLQAIISGLNHSIWAVDKNYNYTIFNWKFVENIKTVYNIDVKQGDNFRTNLPEKDEIFWRSMYDRCFTGEQVNFEKTYGGERYFQYSFFPITINKEITGVFVLSTETTDRIREINKLIEVEKAVAKSEHALQTIINGLNHSIWAVDKNYNYTIFNQRFAENIKLGFNVDAKLGEHYSKYANKYLPKDGNFWESLYEQCFKGEYVTFQASYEGERYFEYSFFPITISNEITGVFVMSIDITERVKESNKLKTIEDAAAKSAFTLQTVINGLEHGIWAVDRSYMPTFYNSKSLENIKSVLNIDVKPGDIITTTLPLEAQNFWNSMYDKCFLGEQLNFEKIYPGNRHFQYSLYPIIVNKEVTGVFVMSLEITDRIRASNKLKEVEKAAAKSEYTLQALVNGINHSIWAVDKNRNFTIFNQKFVENMKTEYNAYPKLGNNYLIGLPEEDGTFWKRMHDRCFNGEQLNFDKVYRGQRHIQYSFSPIVINNEIIGVFVMSVEITEKIRQQEEIKLNEEKYRNLVETSPAAILIIDVDTNTITDSNKQAEVFFKATKEEIAVWSPGELSMEYQEDGRLSSVASQNYITRAMNGEELIFDWTHKDSKGNAIPAQVWLSRFPSNSGALVRATIIDISERKKHQQELQDYIDLQDALISKVKEQESSLLALFNSFSDFICSVDRNLNITEFNNSLKVAVKNGFQMDLERGMPVEKILVPELKSDGIENLKKCFTGKVVKDVLRYKNYMDQYVYMDMNYSPIFSDNEEVIGVTVISRNITENKLAEEKLFEINKQIAEYKLMALRSVMNPHFIFNSLNSIQYFVAKNERRLALDYLSIFSTLIRKILNSSVNHIIPLNTELEILKNYITLEKLRFEEKFDFSLNVAPDVEVEEIEIPSLLIQPYVENAILHGLMNKDGNGRLTINVCQENEYLLFIVEDDGIGREKAKQIKISNDIEEKSYGMLLTQERLDIINKTVNVSVKVEDLVNSNQAPQGTRVTISIKV